MMVLYTETANHLEQVPQESDEDEEFFTSRKPFTCSKSPGSLNENGEDENVKADEEIDDGSSSESQGYETIHIRP